MDRRVSRLTLTAMMAALTALFGLVPDFGTFKLSLESLPVLLAGFMFGPASGALAGGIGTFLSQLLRYGVTVTTPLWLLPYAAAGAAAGFCARRGGFCNSRRQILLMTCVCEILITLLNSLAMFADAKLFGYYSPALWGSMAVRAVSCALKSAAFGLLIPALLRRLSRYTGNPRPGRN